MTPALPGDNDPIDRTVLIFCCRACLLIKVVFVTREDSVFNPSAPTKRKKKQPKIDFFKCRKMSCRPYGLFLCVCQTVTPKLTLTEATKVRTLAKHVTAQPGACTRGPQSTSGGVSNQCTNSYSGRSLRASGVLKSS